MVADERPGFFPHHTANMIRQRNIFLSDVASAVFHATKIRIERGEQQNPCFGQGFDLVSASSSVVAWWTTEVECVSARREGLVTVADV